MTPPAAATAAGRRRATGMRASGSSRVGGVRRSPRRVSGPARPVARAAAAAAAAAVALPQQAPRRAPVPQPRPRAVPRPARRPDLPTNGFAVGARARALRWLRALPDHRLLQRLIGGRIWIVLIGGLLVGIVTMQLTLLRLNAGIGAAVQQTAALEQRNAELRLAISRLSDSERIVALGTQMGLVTPPQGSPRFLRVGSGDAARALATMRVPNATPAPILTAADTTVTDPTAVDPATGLPVDPTATTDPATVDPSTTTMPDPAATDPAATAPTAPVTTDPAAATTAPALTDTAAVTGAPAPAAGGAAAPTPGQG
jgi:hypothetical protein